MGKPARVLIAGSVLAACCAAGIAGRIDTEVAPQAHAAAPAQLPRGGTSVLPENRVVAFDGVPGAPQLGILGTGSPESAAGKLRRFARRYKRPSRPVLPAFELIGVVALAGPGRSGKYRARQPAKTIRRYLSVARRHDYLLIIDIQPGRSTFTDEARALKPFLREPDVGVALDPEWNMGRDGVPSQSIGHVSAAEVNRVSGYMAEIVRRQELPDKILVVHQFTPAMVRSKAALKARGGIDLVLNADGFGGAAAKRSKYRELAPSPEGRFFRGFKLFFVEDRSLMSPGRVLKLRPRPVDLVIYE